LLGHRVTEQPTSIEALIVSNRELLTLAAQAHERTREVTRRRRKLVRIVRESAIGSGLQ
jgi:hypothetical protein